MRRELEIREKNPSAPYRLNIIVNAEVYEKFKDRLKLRELPKRGRNSKQMEINQAVFEKSIDSITDEQLDRLISDIFGGKNG